MVELEDPLVPSKTRPFGDARKWSMGNGDGMYKQRKVSAKRDFPPRCGRNALEIDGKLGAENLTVGADDASSFGGAGIIVESELPKLSKCSNQMESSDSPKPETAEVEVSACLNQTTLLEPFKNSEPEIANQSQLMEMPGDLDLTEPTPSQKDSVQLLDVSAPVEATDGNVPKRYPRRRLSSHRDFPRGCGRNAPPLPKEAATLSGKKSTGDHPLIEMDENVNAKNTAGKSKGNITKKNEGEFHVESPVRNDVIEDKTEEITDNVQVRAAIRKKLKGEDVKEISENFQISAAGENKSSESYMRSQSSTKMVKREAGSSVKEVGKQSDKHRKDGKSEIKFMGEPVDKNVVASRSHGEGSIYSESDKMIVHTKIGGNEKKKEVPEEDFMQRSVSKKKKNGSGSLRNTDSPEGKTANRKLPRTGMTASQLKNKAAVKDDEDSLPHEDRTPGSQELSVSLIPFGPNRSGTSDYSEKATPRRKVRETLRLFQAICRKLLREEETKSNQHVSNLGRIDLTAVKLMKDRNKCVNTGTAILGSVPGVEVGDEFHYRVELAIIGLHRPYQSGIDYMKQKQTILATSVVASGGYGDDTDSSDVLIYSGQGGKPASGDKQPEDQKLERGNLSLKNSIDAKTPVRVIRGFKEHRGSDSQDVKGKMSTTFTYDGLYFVEKYWQEKADHGCSVFKFQMRRAPGQPELAIKEVKKSKKMAVREGLRMKDISQGKEKKSICVVNTIDDDRPLPFEYITKLIYPSWYKPTRPSGCDCPSGCSDSKKCVCVIINGGEIPFNHNGAIVEAKPLVNECGPSCKCPPSCYNRVSQHGIKFQLEVFKTETRGWGVRSLTSIPSGSFICEYTGELLKDKEAEQRTSNDEYLFDIGHNFNEKSLWDGLSALVPTDSQSSVLEKVEDGEYTIDAAKCGNVGRFINHSCSPNLYAQNVLYDHDDKSMPHIMFFAAENIPPLQELTYHYNYTIGQVHDSSGNVKQKNCYCGSLECTGRLY